MGIIRTLNGDISANQLGVTYSHDHIYCIPPYWAERQDDDLLLDDPQASERELSDFRRAGGNAIYDATAPDYGRQAAAVAAMAQRQQLHIIATAGFNKGFLWSSKRPGSALAERQDSLGTDVLWVIFYAADTVEREKRPGVGDLTVQPGIGVTIHMSKT